MISREDKDWYCPWDTWIFKIWLPYFNQKSVPQYLESVCTCKVQACCAGCWGSQYLQELPKVIIYLLSLTCFYWPRWGWWTLLSPILCSTHLSYKGWWHRNGQISQVPWENQAKMKFNLEFHFQMKFNLWWLVQNDIWQRAEWTFHSLLSQMLIAKNTTKNKDHPSLLIFSIKNCFSFKFYDSVPISRSPFSSMLLNHPSFYFTVAYLWK